MIIFNVLFDMRRPANARVKWLMYKEESVKGTETSYHLCKFATWLKLARLLCKSCRREKCIKIDICGDVNFGKK